MLLRLINIFNISSLKVSVVINVSNLKKNFDYLKSMSQFCVEQYFRATLNSHSNFSNKNTFSQTGLKFDWRFERTFGNARFSRRYGTRRYVFQMMWSFQDGPASVLPLTQTLSNIYGRRSASPDVPGTDVDEIQVRKRVKCKSKLRIFETCFKNTHSCTLSWQVLQTKTCSIGFVK